MAGDIFHICQVTRSSSSIKGGFPPQGEKFPPFNLPYAYLGYVHLLYQPTTKLQALPSLSISVLKDITAGIASLRQALFTWKASSQAMKSPTYKCSSSLNIFKAWFRATQRGVEKGTGQVKTKVELHHLSSYIYCNLHQFGLKSSQVYTWTLQK